MTITSERPGVYTSYQVTNLSYSNTSRGVAGIVAVAGTGNANRVYSISSPAQAKSSFGTCKLSQMIDVLFRNGISEVRAVPVFPESQGMAGSLAYANAFELLAAVDEVQAIVCDSISSAVHVELKKLLTGDYNRNRYKIGIVESSGVVSTVTANAANLNCARIVMVSPHALNDDGQTADIGLLAAAVAGAVLSEPDPAVPVNGAELFGLSGVNVSFNDSEINLLVKGGVCPVECVGGRVSIVRGVTTYTTDASGENDPTWRELTTVRIVDNVIPEVRDSLRTLFARSKNTAQTRDAIRTQVVVVLEKKLNEEIIDSYGSITVAQDDDDPTVCNVSFEFAVAHGINKIILTANVTV